MQVLSVRLTENQIAQIDAWRARRFMESYRREDVEPMLNRNQAIRRLLEIGLKVDEDP